MPADMDQMTTQLNGLDVIDDNDQVLLKTLMNPVILDKVFSFLDTTALKSVRLACTAWADVATTFLGKQGCLTFSSSPNCNEMIWFNHKLAKNVKLHMMCGCYQRCECSPDKRQTNRNLPPTFAILLPQICQNLDTLCFLVGHTFIPDLYEMWSTYNFPNLSRITILVMNPNFENYVDLTLPEMAEFRPLPNLKVFSLWICPEKEQYFCGGSLSLFERLQSSSPNLEELHLTGSFYPDLTPYGKLKELRFDFVECRDLFTKDIVQLDLAKMARMLENCRNSLEKLTLVDYSQHRANSIAREKLDIHLPNLTHLAALETALHIIEDSLDIANLPKLAHLSITASYPYVLSTMFANYNLPHVGITSLHVGCSHNMEIEDQDGQAAAKLVSLFPAVKEFKLNLAIEFVDDFSSLEETMEPFGAWELTSGQVEIEYCWVPEKECVSNIVIAVLGGMVEWKGLANTCLEINGSLSDSKLKLTDKMRAALLACRTIRSVGFKDFRVDEETADAFAAFIHEHNLPISFTEY